MSKRIIIHQLSLIIFIVFISHTNANPFQVSYPGFGTFTLKDFHDPILRPIVFLPDSPERIKPKFGLYTRQNPIIPQFLQWNNRIFYNLTNFNPKLDTKIMIHGLARHYFDFWAHLLKDNYLTKHNNNVIIVGWGKGSLRGYFKAMNNARVVGKIIGKLIENLVKHYGVSFDSFHLIGHSLGAHTAGYAGKYLKGRVGRITGLDPAGPCFDFINDTSVRLWHTDAKFVDVIHTDTLPTMTIGAGTLETCGHVDVYPNGGATQNGCEDGYKVAGPIVGTIVKMVCEHYRACKYFLESFDPPISDPVAHKCDSLESLEKGECNQCDPKRSDCVIIDPNVRKYSRVNQTLTQGRRFFLRTSSKPPFMRYQISIKIKFKTPKLFNKPGTNDLELILIDHKGEKDVFEFDKSMHQISTNEFTNFFVSNIDPEKLKDIQVRFKKNQGKIRPSKVFDEHVEYIKYTALSFKGGSKRMRPLTYEKRQSSQGLKRIG